MIEYLKRKIDKFLIQWHDDENRKPLIVKGARQVGKTKSILNFGENHFDSVVYINFVSDPEYKQITDTLHKRY